MGINFPASPVVGDLYPVPPQAGVPQYKWDGVAWIAQLENDVTYVKRSGDTMTGILTLSGMPSVANDAASKAYVDQYKPFIAGTKMLFVQGTAPVGWTKTTDTNQHNIGLRIATQGAEGGGVGGTVGFTTIFSRTATDVHTLNATQIPNHFHNFTAGNYLVILSSAGGVGGNGGAWVSAVGQQGTAYSTGGDQNHSHGIDLRLKYIDAIMATRDA